MRLLKRQTHVSGPSMALPENPTKPNHKKNTFFLKNAETTIFVRFGAHRRKSQMFKNVDFRFRETPKTPWERKSCPRDPPRRAPEPALELPGPPRTVPRAPQSPQGPHQIHKVGMLKTLEICVFGTQESQKNVP